MPIAPATVADMQNLNRAVDDSIVDAPARRLSIQCTADRQIEISRFRCNQMRIGHRAKGEDGVADARQPFVRCPRVAVAQPDP